MLRNPDRGKHDTIDIQELIDRYSTGERDFSSIKVLEYLKVPRGQNLSGIILRGCKLHEVDFSETILVDADLSRITCSYVNFRNANWRNANINAATFWEGTDLSGADLSFANLRKLIVEDAILQGAILTGADLSKSYIKGADFRAANFERVNLRDAWISNSNLRDADLAGVDLNIMKQWALNETAGANLDGTIMPGSPILKHELNSTPAILLQIRLDDIETIEKDYLQFGDRLGTIKFLRGQTGWDLLQAKNAIDSLMKQ